MGTTTDDDNDDGGLCGLCERTFGGRGAVERCVTDCAHEFCLPCLCRRLTDLRNLCPVCGARVRTVHQLHHHDGNGGAPAEAPPASIRFNNAVYVLHVSIWSVEDPARVLAGLFHLEHARLIHKGKLLKKGDVWPGTVVQLFGTRRGSSHADDARGGAWGATKAAVSALWTCDGWHRLKTIACCPCSVLFDFVRSLFVQDDIQRRGYQRIENPHGSGRQSTSVFHEPGRVSSPRVEHATD